MTTNRETCTDALRKVGVTAIDEPATADQIEVARAGLERMLRAWQNRGYSLFTVTSMSVALTTAASYTLSVRPVRVQSVRFKRSGIELPMTEMNREEYDNLPIKTTTGIPTTYYYDRQRDSGVLYVWPVLSVAASETLEITYVRPIAAVDLDDAVDFPIEYYDAVVYGLAARLLDDFGVNNQNLIMRAEYELDVALAGDRAGSVYFVGDGYAR